MVLVEELIDASLQSEIDYILNNWLMPDFERNLRYLRSSFIIAQVFETGNLETRSEILESITDLKAVEALTGENFSNAIQYIVENGSCSTDELKRLLSWLLPEIKHLLKNKPAGFAIFKLFQHSIQVLFHF